MIRKTLAVPSIFHPRDDHQKFNGEPAQVPSWSFSQAFYPQTVGSQHVQKCNMSNASSGKALSFELEVLIHVL